MVQRGAESWTSLIRCCGAPLPRSTSADSDHGDRKLDVETKKDRIEVGTGPKIRLSTPTIYFRISKDVDRYLAAFDEYRRQEE